MKRSHGYVLMAAVVVIALMMAAGTLMASSLQYRMWLLRQETQDVQLTALTDAGLAKALDRFYVSHSWDGEGQQTVGQGTVEIRVEMGQQALQRVVWVTAIYANAGRTVRAVVLLSDYFPPRVISWEPVAFLPKG